MTPAPLRILVVEDNPADANLTRIALEESGLPIREILTASDVETAAALLAHEEVSVILLDLNLPRMSGTTTLLAIRAVAPEVPIVVLTGMDGDGLPLAALSEGAQEFLRKGDMDAAALERAIHFAVQRRERERWSAFIHRALAALTSTLELPLTLRTLAQLAVPTLADWCVIELIGEDGELRVAEIVAALPSKHVLLQEKLARFRHGQPGGGHPVDVVLRTARPHLCEVVDDDCRHRMGYDEEHRQLLAELDPRSMVVVPLGAGGRTVGALTLSFSDSGRSYGPRDVKLLLELAALATGAIANAERFGRSEEALQSARGEMERVAHLAALSSELSEALLPSQVGRITLRHGRELVGACSGLLLVPGSSEEALELLATAEVPETALQEWSVIQLQPASPLADAIRRRRPRVIVGGEAGASCLPGFDRILEACGSDAFLAVPLVSEEQLAGVLLLLAPSEVLLARDLQESLALGARSCAVALAHARLYEREQRAKEEARQAVGAYEKILAVVAHDLRNPLSAISMYAAMLPEAATERDLERISSGIDAAASRMDRLIQDLLDHSRLEVGSIQLRLGALSPMAILEEAARMIEPVAGSKGLCIEVHAAGELPAVAGDGDRLQQILSNLLGNAVSLTPEGTITLRALPLEGEVMFMVSDTGPGIPTELQTHVFERFWGNRRDAHRGAGLGLTIAKSLVELHGGRIGVESEPEAGATFFFTIPLAHSAAAPSLNPVEAFTQPAATAMGQPAGNLAETSLPPARVFLVDDHPAILRGLRDFLGRVPDYELVGDAASAEEALRRLDVTPIDLVLMDIDLPGMDGVAAIRSINKNHPEVAVLALTGSSEEDLLADVLAAGGCGFVSKAHVQEELLPAMAAARRREIVLHSGGARTLVRGFRERSNPGRGSEDPGIAELSEPERRVLGLSAAGFNSAEIGRMIFASPKTVDSYRSRSMRRLGIRGRAAMVAFTLDTGLLQAEIERRERDEASPSSP
jgi:signal transduction histidine kinase/DNA-binding NarL/FixJ family response regulator